MTSGLTYLVIFLPIFTFEAKFLLEKLILDLADRKCFFTDVYKKSRGSKHRTCCSIKEISILMSVHDGAFRAPL